MMDDSPGDDSSAIEWLTGKGLPSWVKVGYSNRFTGAIGDPRCHLEFRSGSQPPVRISAPPAEMAAVTGAIFDALVAAFA